MSSDEDAAESDVESELSEPEDESDDEGRRLWWAEQRAGR